MITQMSFNHLNINVKIEIAYKIKIHKLST